MAIPALRGAVHACLRTAPLITRRAITNPHLPRLFQSRIPKTHLPRLPQKQRWNTTEAQTPPKGKTNRTAFLEGLGLGGVGAGIGTSLIIYNYLKDNPPSERWADFVNKMRCPVSAENYAKLQEQLEVARQRNNTLQRERDVLAASKNNIESKPKETEGEIFSRLRKICQRKSNKHYTSETNVLEKTTDALERRQCEESLKTLRAALKTVTCEPGNSLMPLTAETLGEALKRNLNPGLTHICIKGQYLLHHDVLFFILEGLLENSHITSLDISSTPGFFENWAINSRDLNLIIVLIETNPNLSQLKLNNNNLLFSNEQVERLVLALKHNQKISLSLFNTGLTNENKRALLTAAGKRVVFD